MYKILDWVSNNRKLAIFLAILIIFLLITGLFFLLNGRNNFVTVNRALPLQGTTLTKDMVWWVTDEEAANQEALDAVVAGFKLKYPTVNIKVENKKTDLAMLEEFLSNPDNQPDFMTISSKYTSFYQKYSAPNQYFKTTLLANYLAESVETVRSNTIVSNEVYGVPLHVDNLQLYVNKNLIPNLAVNKTPAKSWDFLKSQAASFDKSKGQNLIALGAGSDTVNNAEDILGAMMVQRKIYLDSKSKDLDEDEFARVLGDYTFFKQYLTTNSSDYDAFKQGKTLYYIDYFSANTRLKAENQSLNYEIYDMPKYDDENSTSITYAKFFTTLAHKSQEAQGPEHKRLADDFIYYLSTEAAQKIFADKTDLPSANKKVLETQIAAQSNEIKKFYEQAQTARAIVPSCSVKYSSAINSLISGVNGKGNEPKFDAILPVVSEYKSVILDSIYNQNVCLPYRFLEN